VITPDEIRAKAERLYPKVVRAWLDGDDIFPYVLPSSKKHSGDIAADIRSVEALRTGSREVRGFGYSVEWARKTVKSVRNDVPTLIVFETRDDLLRLIDRLDEFEAFTEATQKLRMALPQLEGWIRRHHKTVTTVASIIDDLIHVTQHHHGFDREDDDQHQPKNSPRRRKQLQQNAVVGMGRSFLFAAHSKSGQGKRQLA